MAQTPFNCLSSSSQVADGVLRSLDFMEGHLRETGASKPSFSEKKCAEAAFIIVECLSSDDSLTNHMQCSVDICMGHGTMCVQCSRKISDIRMFLESPLSVCGKCNGILCEACIFGGLETCKTCTPS